MFLQRKRRTGSDNYYSNVDGETRSLPVRWLVARVSNAVLGRSIYLVDRLRTGRRSHSNLALKYSKTPAITYGTSSVEKLSFEFRATTHTRGGSVDRRHGVYVVRSPPFTLREIWKTAYDHRTTWYHVSVCSCASYRRIVN